MRQFNPDRIRNKDNDRKNRSPLIIFAGFLSAFLVFIVGLKLTHKKETSTNTEKTAEVIASSPLPEIDKYAPIREEPKTFHRRTHLPTKGEGDISGSIDLSTFSPGRDLMYIDDKRVWWESDHDRHDVEDDHSIHKAMELPLRRLIELVCKEKGRLKIQDTYRPQGKVHNSQSLHKEGRGIDVTCDELSLEKLAKLCWAAGFDWVYYETRGGHHIHCSVKRQ